MQLTINLLQEKVSQGKATLKAQENLREELLERLVSIHQDIRSTKMDIDNYNNEIKELEVSNYRYGQSPTENSIKNYGSILGSQSGQDRQSGLASGIGAEINTKSYNKPQQ